MSEIALRPKLPFVKVEKKQPLPLPVITAKPSEEKQKPIRDAFREAPMDAQPHGHFKKEDLQAMNQRTASLGYGLEEPRQLSGEKIFDHFAAETAEALKAKGIEMSVQEFGRMGGAGDDGRIMLIEVALPGLGKHAFTLTPRDIGGVTVNAAAIERALERVKTNVAWVSNPKLSSVLAPAVEAGWTLDLTQVNPTLNVDVSQQEAVRRVFGSYTELATKFVFAESGFDVATDLEALATRVGEELRQNPDAATPIIHGIRDYCYRHRVSELFHQTFHPKITAAMKEA